MEIFHLFAICDYSDFFKKIIPSSKQRQERKSWGFVGRPCRWMNPMVNLCPTGCKWLVKEGKELKICQGESSQSPVQS